jgi:hypothetical protein
MVEETGLESLCSIANSPTEMVKLIQELKTKNFSDADLNNRSEVLGNTFENNLNAEKLVQMLF